MAENFEITDTQKQALETFDPNKTLVINCAEIEGLEDYVGRFVFRRPTNGDRIKIGVLNSKITEGQTLDVFASNLAYAIATFNVVCTEKPKGFDFEGIDDADPVFALFTKYMEWQELFRLQLQLRKERTSKA